MGKGVKTASGEVVNLKTSYELSGKNEAFYAGGEVHFTSDGQYVLTTCASTVKVLSVASGRVEKTIEEAEDLVTSFGVSGDSTVLVVAWRSLLLRQYMLDDCKPARSWKGHIGPVVAMDFDATSTLLATGSTDSTVKVWDCTKNYCTHNLRGSKGMVGVVKFHPNPEHLLLFTSASIDCAVRVWDLSSSSCIHLLSGHVSAVTALGIPGDGTTVLSAGRDKVIHVWDLETGAAKKTLPVFESVEGLVLLPDELFELEGPVKQALPVHKKKKVKMADKHGLLFATAGDKGVVRVWSTENSSPLCTCQPLATPITVTQSSHTAEESSKDEEEKERDSAHVFTSLHLCQSQGSICGVTHDHNLVFYSLPEFSLGKQLIGFLDEVLDISLVGEGESHVAVATNSEEVKVFERESGSCQLLSGHSAIVLAISASSDGRLLATGSKDNTVRLWKMSDDSRQFDCVAIGTGHTHAVGAVAISRLKSSFIVSGSQDCTMKMWKVGRSLVEGEKDVDDRDLDVSRLKVKYTHLAHDKDINALDISPNDRLIVSGSQDKTAKLWQVTDGSLLGKFKGHRRGVWSVKFSPIDQCVATASGDGAVKLWAVADFSCVKTFEGHVNSALKVCFLSRGMQLASCGSDGLVKVWTIKTNECVATLDHHTEKVWCLAACGDGREIISGGADSLICYWKDVTERVEEEAELQREEQILKEQELSNLIHQKNYVKAVGVAISLGQPFRVLQILQELLDDGGVEGQFKETILSLREDQMHSVLQFASRWNTNARHCPIAQSVLTILLRYHSPEKLMELDDIKSLLEGLLPYTERHFQRLTRLQQLSSFVEYTWQCMKLPTLEATDVERLSENEPATPTLAVMVAADSTSQVDEAVMEGEDESESEGVGEEDTESVEEVSVQDVVSSDDNVTSSTMELKSKGTRKQRLKARLLKAKASRKISKLSLLTSSKRKRTKLRK